MDFEGGRVAGDKIGTEFTNLFWMEQSRPLGFPNDLLKTTLYVCYTEYMGYI